MSGGAVDLAVAGLGTGAVAALSGLGVLATYRITGVLNVAFGAIGMLGAYLVRALVRDAHLPGYAAGFIIVFCIAPLLGLVLEAAVFGPIQQQKTETHADDAGRLLTAGFGITVLLVGLATAIWGEAPRTDAPSLLPGGTLHVAGVDAPTAVPIEIALVLLVAVGLTWFSHSGPAIRAVIDDRRLAESVGLPARRLARIGWVIGTMLATLTGVLLAPQLRFDPPTLTLVIFETLGVAIAARLASAPRAILFAFATAIAQAELTGVHLAGAAGSVLDAVRSNLFVVLLLIATWASPTFATGASGSTTGLARRTPRGPHLLPPNLLPFTTRATPTSTATTSNPATGSTTDSGSVSGSGRRTPHSPRPLPPNLPPPATRAIPASTTTASDPVASSTTASDSTRRTPRHPRLRPPHLLPFTTRANPERTATTAVSHSDSDAALRAPRFPRLRPPYLLLATWVGPALADAGFGSAAASRSMRRNPRSPHLLSPCLLLLLFALFGWNLRAVDLHAALAIPALALVLLSFRVLHGAGLLSLGQAGLAGVGALAAGWVASGWGILAAPVAGAVVAGVLALPVLRQAGLHLAVATLAAATALSSFVFDQPLFTPSAVQRPSFAESDRVFLYLELGLTLLALATLTLLTRGPAALRLAALRDSELAARAVGIAVDRVRLGVFAGAGAVAALGGALWAAGDQVFDPTAFEPAQGLIWFAAAAAVGFADSTALIVAAIVLVVADSYVAGASAILVGVATLVLPRVRVRVQTRVRGFWGGVARRGIGLEL